MYYILLKGFQLGLGWQRRFLYCSLVQVVIDVFIFETIECVWLNFTVPHYVRQEVSVAVTILQQLTEQLTCSGDDEEQQHHAAHERGFIVNAPAHLFVSVRLAETLPQLLESTIVSSYKHHLPGAICKTWPHCTEQQEQGPQPCTGWVVFLRSLLRGVLLAVQVLITGPYMYQRIFLRFAMPVLFSGVCSIFYVIIHSSTVLAVLGGVLGLVLAYAVWSMYCGNRPNIADTTEVDANEVPTCLFEPEIEVECAVPVVPRRPSQISLSSSSLCTPSLPSDLSEDPQEPVHRSSADDASSSEGSVSSEMLVQDDLPAVMLKDRDSADDASSSTGSVSSDMLVQDVLQAGLQQHRDSADDDSSSEGSVYSDMLVQEGLPAVVQQHRESADDASSSDWSICSEYLD